MKSRVKIGPIWKEKRQKKIVVIVVLKKILLSRNHTNPQNRSILRVKINTILLAETNMHLVKLNITVVETNTAVVRINTAAARIDIIRPVRRVPIIVLPSPNILLLNRSTLLPSILIRVLHRIRNEAVKIAETDTSRREPRSKRSGFCFCSFCMCIF